MSRPLLHIAAFWIDGDHADPITDDLMERKMDGTKGAVVTFSPEVANDPEFRRTMSRLHVEEVNAHPSPERVV